MKRLFCFFIILALVAPHLSSEPEAKGLKTFHFNWKAFFGKVLNSLILFGGLYLILRKPLAKFLEEKSTSVRRDIEERERNIQTSEEKMNALQQRLERLEDEIRAMKEASTAAGREQMQQLENLGCEETGRILNRTETEINLRMEAAVKQLKARIADLAIDRFSSDFQARSDEQIQRKLIDQGIEQAEKIDVRK